MAFPNQQSNPKAAIPVWVAGGTVPPIAGGGVRSLGYEYISSLATVKALTVPAGATAAVINVVGGLVNYRDDGVDPTNAASGAGGGMELLPTTNFNYNINLANIRFIQQTGFTAKLNVSYYGPTL